MTPEPALVIAGMVTEVAQRDRADSPVKKPQDEVGRAAENDAINDRAGHESLAPHQSADRFFRHIGQVVDDDWGFHEEAPDLHVQIEKHRPEKG